jgi:hypothetical protein
MGGSGTADTTWVEGESKLTDYKSLSAAFLAQRATSDKSLEPTAAMQTPTLSDEEIRNAILAERSRALSGNSRKAAFAVRDQSTSYTGE